MRKIYGIKAAAFLGLLLSFSICLASLAAPGRSRNKTVSIPYFNIQKAGQEGVFLLVFDTSGSMWTPEKDELAEDFKTIYLYLSEQPWAAEHDVILFDETDRLRSESIEQGKQDGESGHGGQDTDNWKGNKNTDLKNAFQRLDNYLKGILDKPGVHVVMVSDFYDSSRGETYTERKKEMDKIVSSFGEGHIDKEHLYQAYFIFDSPEEEKSGYKQYLPPVDEGDRIPMREPEGSEEDNCGKAKRMFVERVLQGLTGERDLQWKQRRDISPDDFENCRDYFVYSDREVMYSDDYWENVVWDCPLKSGGYIYHINGAGMEKFKLNRSTRDDYILVMPHIQATIVYSRIGYGNLFQEGKMEVTLEIDKYYRDLVQADYFDMVFSIDRDKKNQGVFEYCRLDKKQNHYEGDVDLKPGNYCVRLRRSDGDIFLDQIVEEEFVIREEEGK